MMSVGFLKKRARGKKYRKNMTAEEKASSEEVFQEVKRIVLTERISAYRHKEHSPASPSIRVAAEKLRYELSLLSNDKHCCLHDAEIMCDSGMLEMGKWALISSGKKLRVTDGIQMLADFTSLEHNAENSFFTEEDAVLSFCPELDFIIPDDPDGLYDIRMIISSIVDKGALYIAPDIFSYDHAICLARIGGHPVGIIAGQAIFVSGFPDSEKADKVSKFIRFCDALNIPVLSITESDCKNPGTGNDWNEKIRHSAKLLWSYSAAKVPKLLLVTRKCGDAGVNPFFSRFIGSDAVFVWPVRDCDIYAGIDSPAPILGKSYPVCHNASLACRNKTQNYEFLFSTSRAIGFSAIDEIEISPSETRLEIASAISVLSGSNKSRRDFYKKGASRWTEMESFEELGFSVSPDAESSPSYSACTK